MATVSDSRRECVSLTTDEKTRKEFSEVICFKTWVYSLLPTHVTLGATCSSVESVNHKNLRNAPIVEAIIDARMAFAEPPEPVALREFANTLPGASKT